MGCKISCTKSNRKKKQMVTVENTNQNIISNKLTDNHNLEKFQEPENKMEREELHHSTKIDLKEYELKINLFSENIPQGKLEKHPVKNIINKETLGHSLDENQSLAFLGAVVPFLNGLYTAHINHYPFRIKPDDIWLLIVQAFSNHVNANSEELRNYFVNFDGKKTLEVIYPGIYYKENVDKKILEDFSVQINKKMEEYLGKEILQTLTPNFSTSDYNSKIISKISIMGAFKKYFDYLMYLPTCGIPYIILEGTSEDYEKIKEKAEKLSKYKFEWYINRIIPHIQKMIEAKKGNIDIEYFKNIIQKNKITEVRWVCLNKYEVQVDNINGWILDFFAYKKYGGKIHKFTEQSLKVKEFDSLANQMLIVPFIINEEITGKTYDMKYTVGFIGCDQNKENEVLPVQGFIVSPCSKEEDSIL